MTSITPDEKMGAAHLDDLKGGNTRQAAERGQAATDMCVYLLLRWCAS